MILRPATPLALIFLVAFVLLLLATLSVPVIKSIPLGTYQGWDFGVLGYCHPDEGCTGPLVGYNTDGLFSGNVNEEFSLPSSARTSLSSILIIHPVAAAMALVCFFLAVAAHFHGPSHSPRYLLALLIITIPTLLVTLLAFLVDILIFVPHMSWGGWIVLGATILIIASSVVTCAMRRTLVSRKARKKRIAENADMNGANYYETLNQHRMMADQQALPRADSPPPMTADMAGDKGLSQYAAFEMKRQDTLSNDGGVSADDRIPLNPVRDSSVRSASTGPYSRSNIPYRESEPYQTPSTGRISLDSNGNPTGRRPSNGQYGDSMNYNASGVPPVAFDGTPLRHQNSQGSLRGSPSRGRGFPGPGPAYSSRGRGYGPPPPGFRGRGGYGPPMRGGYPPRGGPYPRGGPRGGYRGRGAYGPLPADMMARSPPPAAMRAVSPPDYAQPYGMPGPYSPASNINAQSPILQDATAADTTVGGIGQAVEMNEQHGTLSDSRSFRDEQYHSGGTPVDGTSSGNVPQGLPRSEEREHEALFGGPRFEGQGPRSDYADQTYVPPRNQWPSPNFSAATKPMPGSIEHHDHSIQGVSSDVPARGTPPLLTEPSSRGQLPPSVASLSRSESQPYYEDVDPRFAEGSALSSTHENHGHIQPGTENHPLVLTPGGYNQATGASPEITGVRSLHTAEVVGAENGASRLVSPPPLGHNAFAADTQHSSQPVLILPNDHGHNTTSEFSYTDNRRGDNEASPIRRNANDSRHIFGHSPVSRPSSALADNGGTRSPEGSEISHFTSVSQRGVNPNWRPNGGSAPGSGYGPNSAYGGGAAPSSASAAQRRREDIVLNANPDFTIPGVGLGAHGGIRSRGMGGGRGMIGRGNGAIRGGGSMLRPGGMSPTAGGRGNVGLTPGGRYPVDI